MNGLQHVLGSIGRRVGRGSEGGAVECGRNMRRKGWRDGPCDGWFARDDEGWNVSGDNVGTRRWYLGKYATADQILNHQRHAGREVNLPRSRGEGRRHGGD